MAVPVWVDVSSEARQSAATASPEEETETNAEGKEEEGEVVAVLVVWQRVRGEEAEAAAEAEAGAESALPPVYGSSDELILRTLASVTGRLLLQDEEMTKLRRAHGEVARRGLQPHCNHIFMLICIGACHVMHLRCDSAWLLYQAEQRGLAARLHHTHIMQSVKQPGAQHTATLHASAQRLAAAIGCEWSLLWLVEHVYRGTGNQQQVVTQLPGGAAVTLPVDLPSSGRGLVGLALTTGKTTAVGDALIAPHYQRDVDAAACVLPQSQSAMCVVPLRDHYGQVLGVLQAAGKRQESPLGAPGAGEDVSRCLRGFLPAAEWEGETPAFSGEDVDFLEIMAAKLAASLEVNWGCCGM